MNIVVKDVHSLSPFEKASVRTGTKTIPFQVVDWISVIEAPVESFVRKNEYILTTGVSFAHDENLFMTFVKDVIDSGAAALAFALGPFIDHIPKSIITYASERDFILVELDWSIRFSEIIESVYELLQQSKHQYVEKVEAIRKALLELILTRQPLEKVAHHVAQSIDCEVMIADKRGSIRGKSFSNESNLHERWSEFLHAQLSEEGINQIVNQTFKWIPYDQGYGLQLAIHSAGNIQGYLVIGGFSENPLTPQEQHEWEMLLEHVTTTVAIHFLHEQAAKEAEWRLRDDFVWELSRGSFDSIESLLSRSKSLNYQINLPYLCLVASLEHMEDVYKRLPHLVISFDHWQHECIRYVEEEAESVAKSLALKSMVTYQQQELIIYLETNHPDTVSQAKVYIEKLQKRVSFLYPSICITWGIAKQSGYSCFFEGYQEANRAREIGKKRYGPGCISTYADTKVDRVLEHLLTNEELLDISDSVLDSLLHYQKSRQIDLLHTFTSYHQNRGNVSQTARELNLHRQSLLYRLRKIETLTNCSLDNSDDLFLLDMSIRLWLYRLETSKK